MHKKIILAGLLSLPSAVAVAFADGDYAPTIKCPIHGVQAAPRIDAQFDTADAMYWDSKFLLGEPMLGYVFHRLNNSPDELSFRLENQNTNTVVLTVTLRKGQSVEWVSGSEAQRTELKFWCE